MVSIISFLEIEIVNSKSLKKICRQLLSKMDVLKRGFSPAVGIGLAHLGVFLKHFGPRNSFNESV